MVVTSFFQKNLVLLNMLMEVARNAKRELWLRLLAINPISSDGSLSKIGTAMLKEFGTQNLCIWWEMNDQY
jgi:hypothetical protein